jgi:hypothetical protein
MRHADEFECAVRVVDGDAAAESRRWKQRLSAVDRLTETDPDTGSLIITLYHGTDARLRLCFSGEQLPPTGTLPRTFAIWPALETSSGARVEIAADAGESDRFHLGFL